MTTTHPCHARGCDRAIPLEHLMCPAHWRQVPRLVQQEVNNSYRALHPDDPDTLARYERARTRARLCVEAMSRPTEQRPILYLSHPGRTAPSDGASWCAMGRPREWERSDGRVEPLTPLPDAVTRKNSGAITSTVFRAMFDNRLRSHVEMGHLVPGVLAAKPWSSKIPFLDPDPEAVVVADGDILWCACGRDKALAGRCHLAWTIPFLLRSGWIVDLFGQRHPALAAPQLSLFGGP